MNHASDIEERPAAVEEVARAANAPDLWDRLWRAEGDESWRATALRRVYDRVLELVPDRLGVVDVGGGIGLLAAQLCAKREGRAPVEVWDHSFAAVRAVQAKGIAARHVDLEARSSEWPATLGETMWVATEVFEHLSVRARMELCHHMAGGAGALISVPNNRLGPDEEPQHTVQFTAVTLKRELSAFWEHVRVEVMGPYLLAVCGKLAQKKTTLSLTMPVRDEEADIESVLASFRGVADEIVIGLDPRSKDRTREICSWYADVIFELEDPQGPVADKAYAGARCAAMAAAGEKRVADAGIHFAWARNQCLDRCTSEWIFMTEGHERLVDGAEALLSLDQLDAHKAQVALVWRSDAFGQRWGFPWICKNRPAMRYERSTHNSLTYPEGTHVVAIRGIRTLHDRVHERSAERARQRAVQNRLDLTQDWLSRQSEYSLYYLASEWREHAPAKAEAYFRELLALRSGTGALRYQARLILAKMLANRAQLEEARVVLHGCSAEDWSRTEHWIWLGDLAFKREDFEEAAQFYLYGTTRLNDPPFTTWWIDMSHYTYLPAQRLAATYGELGDVERSLHWARRVAELLPPEAPPALLVEANTNISILEEALHAA